MTDDGPVKVVLIGLEGDKIGRTLSSKKNLPKKVILYRENGVTRVFIQQRKGGLVYVEER